MMKLEKITALDMDSRLARILRVLTDALEQFLRAEDWESAINDVLADLGKAAGVSRVCIFANDVDDQGQQSNTLRYEWTAEGVTPWLSKTTPHLQTTLSPWYELGRWSETLARGEIIVSNVHDLPPTKRTMLQDYRLMSTLVVPIFVQGEWWGFITFDDYTRERDWSPVEVDALRGAANLFAAALERRLMEEKARRTSRALSVVGEVLNALNASPDVEKAFPHVVKGLRSLVGCDRVSLALLEEDGRFFRLVALDQPRPELEEGVRLPVDITSVAEDILAGRPHLSPDLVQECDTPAEQDLYKGGHRSRVNIPLRVERKVLGSLNLAWPVVQGYREEDIPLLQQIADALALAIERTSFLRMVEHRREVAEALRDAGLALVSDLDVEQVMDRILTQVKRVIPYDSATIFLHKGDHLRVAAIRGFPDVEEATQRPYPTDNGLFAEIARTRHPLYLEDAQKDPRFENWNHPYEIRGWLGVPLIAKGNLIGFLTLDSAKPGTYGAREAFIAEMFAQQAALALYNAQLYEALRLTNEELERALSAHKHMVRTVSHELRTPLTLVVGSAELLEQMMGDRLSESVRKRIRVIVEQARHVSFLLNKFLDFDRTTRTEMVLHPLNIRSWIEDIYRGWLPIFNQEGQHLKLEVAQDVDEVMAHPEFLRRVMDNLLDNAKKYSPPGRTTTIRVWRQGSMVYVSIQDQGKGVPRKALPHLFDRFFQVDREDIYPRGGLGLGLALCKEIIERHGGRIWAESEGEGKGLTVTFALHVAPPGGKDV